MKQQHDLIRKSWADCNENLEFPDGWCRRLRSHCRQQSLPVDKGLQLGNGSRPQSCHTLTSWPSSTGCLTLIWEIASKICATSTPVIWLPKHFNETLRHWALRSTSFLKGPFLWLLIFVVLILCLSHFYFLNCILPLSRLCSHLTGHGYFSLLFLHVLSLPLHLRLFFEEFY